MALVLWDQYSRTPVVEFVSSTSAECTVPIMEKIFSTYGIPEEIKSDNGPLLIVESLRNLQENKVLGIAKLHLDGRKLTVM